MSESSQSRSSPALGLLAVGTMILAAWTVGVFLAVSRPFWPPLHGYWYVFVGGGGVVTLFAAVPIGSGFIVAGWAARARSFQVHWFLTGVVIGIGVLFLVLFISGPASYTTIFRWMSVAFSTTFLLGAGFLSTMIGAKRRGVIRLWFLGGLPLVCSCWPRWSLSEQFRFLTS